MTLESAKIGIVNTVKSAGTTLMADTPKWAKIVRLVGTAFTAIGGALTTASPATLPIFVATTVFPYSGLITVIGSAMILFAQMTKKNI